MGENNKIKLKGGKIKYSLSPPPLPRMYQKHVVCQFTPTLPLQQQLTLRLPGAWACRPDLIPPVQIRGRTKLDRKISHNQTSDSDKLIQLIQPLLVHGADFSTTPLSRNIAAHLSAWAVSRRPANPVPWCGGCRGFDSLWHSPKLRLLFDLLRNSTQQTITPATQARSGTRTAQSPSYLSDIYQISIRYL